MATATEAIRLRTSGKIVIAEFTKGELKDEREILRLLEKLGELVEKRSGVCVLLNMANVTYISSAGLGALVSLLKKVGRQNGVLRVCCLTDAVRELFEVMQLSKIFTVLGTEEEAIASF